MSLPLWLSRFFTRRIPLRFRTAATVVYLCTGNAEAKKHCDFYAKKDGIMYGNGRTRDIRCKFHRKGMCTNKESIARALNNLGGRP